jgi:hypothetical protein
MDEKLYLKYQHKSSRNILQQARLEQSLISVLDNSEKMEE